MVRTETVFHPDAELSVTYAQWERRALTVTDRSQRLFVELPSVGEGTA